MVSEKSVGHSITEKKRVWRSNILYGDWDWGVRW